MITQEQIDAAVAAIQANLSDDLLSPKWKTIRGNDPNKLVGHCYIGAETIYHLLNGPELKHEVYVMTHELWPEGLDEGETHWYVKTSCGKIADPTCGQFDIPVDYTKSRRAMFLTGNKPSRRCCLLIERIKRI